MAKTMTITYDGKKYTLEFTRNSLRHMTYVDGFDIRSLNKSPIAVFDLFKGAFLAHHSDLDEEEVEKIFGSIGNKSGLLEKLADMYIEPVVSLTDSITNEENEGNATWGVNW